MASYQDDDFLFSASSLEATFTDGSTLRGSNSDVIIHRDTPLGDEVWIVERSGQDSNARGKGSRSSTEGVRVVRLIFITPEQDWRRNQTYAWKLDSAWMSSMTIPSDPSEPRPWLHWNVQSYINSAIQVPASNLILDFEELELLHFRPIRDVDNPYHSPVTHKERLLLKDVQFGLHFPSNNETIELISPCPDDRAFCSIVDGEVQATPETSTAGLPNEKNRVSSSRPPSAKIELEEAGATILLVFSIIILCLCFWRRHQRSKLYEQLSPNPDEDLSLTVEDTYQGSEPRSTITDVINQTG